MDKCENIRHRIRARSARIPSVDSRSTIRQPVRGTCRRPTRGHAAAENVKDYVAPVRERNNTTWQSDTRRPGAASSVRRAERCARPFVARESIEGAPGGAVANRRRRDRGARHGGRGERGRRTADKSTGIWARSRAGLQIIVPDQPAAVDNGWMSAVYGRRDPRTVCSDCRNAAAAAA